MRTPWPFIATLVFAGSALAAEPAASAAQGRMAKACKNDITQYCAGVQAGEGRIAACLKENRAKLSDGCKAAAKGALAERKAAK